MSEEPDGMTGADPMPFAVQVGDGRWIQLDGTASYVDGLCRQIDFPGFTSGSADGPGITAILHIVESAWTGEGGSECADILRMTFHDGLLQTAETVARGVELVPANRNVDSR